MRGIVWLGGSTASGKTAAAQRLAEEWGTGVYQVDAHEHDHAMRAGSTCHRAMHAWNRRTLDETWVELPVGDLVEETLAYCRERFQFILADLEAERRPLIAMPSSTSDPEQALRNRLERDRILGDPIANEARRLGFLVLEIDGGRDLDSVIADIEHHLTPT